MAVNPNSTVEPNIGFVGLGVMGEPMCSNLAKKTRSKVIGFDLSPDPLERLAEEGVARAESLADLACECELIFLSLPDGEAVSSVCFRPDGLVARMKAPSGKDKKMSSHSHARSARLSALATPSSASRSNGSGDRSNPITFDRVFLARFEHMGSPMTPKPTKPILGSTVEFGFTAMALSPLHFHYEATIQ
jgi:hypothetical protein